MKIKMKPFLEGAKLSAYAYVALGLVVATGLQAKITYDAVKAAVQK